jgi:hypothetical protein
MTKGFQHWTDKENYDVEYLLAEDRNVRAIIPRNFSKMSIS